MVNCFIRNWHRGLDHHHLFLWINLFQDVLVLLVLEHQYIAYIWSDQYYYYTHIIYLLVHSPLEVIWVTSKKLLRNQTKETIKNLVSMRFVASLLTTHRTKYSNKYYMDCLIKAEGQVHPPDPRSYEGIKISLGMTGVLKGIKKGPIRPRSYPLICLQVQVIRSSLLTTPPQDGTVPIGLDVSTWGRRVS